MSKSLWPLLLLSLTACGPKVSPEVVTQTVRAGDLEVTFSAPQWVTRQELYPLKVTYTNRGQRAVTFSDPVDCVYIWADGVDRKMGQAADFACPTTPAPLVTLAPGESHAGLAGGIIYHFPAGEYRFTALELERLRPSMSLPDNRWQPLEFSPPVRPIGFQIR